MAYSRSARKRIRQNESHRERNRSNRSRLRTEVKKLRQAVETKGVDKAREMLPVTSSIIDRMVKKGAIHENTGARHKSRLAKLLTRASD